MDIAPGEEVETVSLEKIQEFQAWRRKIKPLLQILDKTPSTELETNISCDDENQVGNDSKFLLDTKLVENCQTLYNELLLQVTEKKKQFKSIWERLQIKVQELEDKEELELTFTFADSGVLKSVMELNSQVMLRETERNKKIQGFIGDLRKEILQIWDQCMVAQEERNAFQEFKSDQHNEEMLNIHKKELIKWQIYHKKNQEILTKITKREEMWTTLRELEAKAEDPNRFVNRGGTLLKDQSTQNYIRKALPKVESDLVKLAQKFEKEHGRKMKILEKEIPQMIQEDWKLFKEQQAAKKLNRQISTPGSGVPLRATRQSIMPSQTPALTALLSRTTEKRPGSRLPVNSTPLSKRILTTAEAIKLSTTQQI